MKPILRHVAQLLVAVMIVTLALVSRARADGVYIPQRAYPALPTIPVQRAIIIHREGIETLIVESAFQSKSPDVAWILPLPAAPTKLELTEAGAISSTAYSLRPEIRHDLHGITILPFVIFLVILPLALATIFIRDNAVLRMSLLVEVFLIVLLIGILLPSLGTAGSSATPTELPGLSILSTQRLGDADFTVLDATTPDVLDQWLTGQGLRSLDAAAKPIVADYIARHWCFVVGTLHNDSSQLSVPRPLMATFPAATPIFPMKLTALANTTTHVELCVFANEQATAPGFHCVIADSFTKHPAEPDDDYFPIRSPYYDSINTSTALGHPDIVPLLWDNCTATKIIADMPPSSMDHDIAIQLQPLTPHRDTFYTSLARRQIAVALLFAGITVFLILAAFIHRGRRPATPRQSKFLLACFLAVFIIPMAAWQFLPTVPVHTSGRLARYQPIFLSSAIRNLPNDDPLFKNLTPERIATLPKLLIDRGILRPEYLTNPFTGQPIRMECSPGNITVRTIDTKTYFCTYDENGIESRTLLP